MLKYFFKTFLGYGGIRILAQIISFCLIPVYTQKLYPAEYSALEYVGIINGILIAIVGLQLGQAAGRILSNTNSKEKQIVISTGFWFTTIGIIICSLVLSLIFNSFDYQFFFTSQFYELFLPNQILFVLNGLYQYLNTTLTWQLQRRKVIIVNSVYIVVNLISAIVFVILFNMHIKGSYASMIISNLIAVALLLYYQKSQIIAVINFEVLKKMVRYSYPLVLALLGLKIWHLLDRRFILNNFGETSLGIYALALKFIGPIVLATGVIESIILPMILKDPESKETKKFVKDLFNIHVLFFLVLLIFVSCFGQKLFPHFVSESFLPVQHILIFVIVSQAIMRVTYFAPGFVLAKNNTPIMIITFIFGILNYVANVIFFSKFSLPVVMFINSIFAVGYLIALHLSSQKYYKLPLPVWRFVLLLFLVLALNQYIEINNFSLVQSSTFFILLLGILGVFYRNMILDTYKYLYSKRKGKT